MIIIYFLGTAAFCAGLIKVGSHFGKPPQTRLKSIVSWIAYGWAALVALNLILVIGRLAS